MSTKVIAFCNVKGGCGKSVGATNLAISLMKKGKHVHALDLDSQGSMEAFLIDYAEDKKDLQHKHIPESAFASLPKMINDLEGKASHVVMDVAGGDVSSIQDILRFTQWLIIPTRPSKKDFAATTAMIVRMGRRGDFAAHPGVNALILMNQCSYHPQSTTADFTVKNLQAIINQCGLQDRVKVLDSRITLATAWIEADMEGLAISDMKRTKSAKQWETLVKELSKKGVI